MYLKNIEVQGFKSFAQKINFEFHNGITGIVGPNGSGKSNVGDAVRWVLGEQSAKQLRGGNMQDVIFSGTELRKPLSFASVAITLDNSDHKLPVDFEEVTVTRRLYRSGESEYRINGSSCRLKDINEMFYDTGIGKEGYSIIGQGQIDKILSGKPEERRELFDEAAGIVKFKRRKNTTLKKLEEEQQNLVRVTDILSELTKQLEPLERQSETAKIYLAKRESLKELDVNMFLLEYEHTGNLIKELEERTGHKVIGNKSASGTEILDELAEEEIATGHMIVYTSADSVLQICGNEETFGLDELYRCCKIARELTMKPEWKVGRVIARPYVGKKKGEFKRTANRHDYALKPYGKTAMDALKEAGFDVISIGKIRDIFDGEGITQAIRSKSSVQGMEQTIECLDQDFTGLCFTNLVDFDALWGHRRNPQGYAEELEKFDVLLGQFLEKMKEDDLVIVTADHGNDPTFKGTDHTKERVPFLAYSPSMKTSGRIDDQNCFAVIGATIADNFGAAMPKGTIGTSVLEQLE